MKIIRNDACYVEKEDIMFLGKFPWEVFDEIDFSDDSKYTKFENKESINYWLKKEDILDYDAISCLNNEELTAKIIEKEKELEKMCCKWLYASNYYRRNLDQNNEYNQQIQSTKYIIETLKKYQSNKEYYDTLFSKIINNTQKVKSY